MRDRKAKKRYGTYYYKFAGDNLVKQDTSGSTDDLARAYGNAAAHCARSELRRDEYAKALIFDRRSGKTLRIYTKTAHSIDIRDLT
jgi:hypothetical protein